MALAALDDVDDAITATRRLLAPFDRVTWFRLAVVAFFLGGFGVSTPTPPTTGFDFGPGAGEPTPGEPTPGGPDITPHVTAELVTLLVGLLAVGVALFLIYSVVGATMEFVFVASLRDEEVRLRRHAKRYWRRGARLFAFRFLGWMLTAAVVGGTVLAVGTALGGWPPTGWTNGAILAALALGVPLVVTAAVVVGAVMGVTTLFVVPVMLREDRGVIGAWRRFWPTLVGGWTEFLVFLVVSFLLSIGIGIAVGFLLLLLAVVLAVPFLVVGAPLVLVLGLSGAGGAVALALLFAFLVLVFVGGLLVQVPFETFSRYYALFVLGDVNDEFDVIPHTRAAVRTDGGPEADEGEPDEGGGIDGDDADDEPGETGDRDRDDP
ncbi:MAG: hypothetical protein ABEJ26_14775 [Halosimplex sp.]